MQSIEFDPSDIESVALALAALMDFPLVRDCFPQYKVKMRHNSHLPPELEKLAAILLEDSAWEFLVDDEQKLFLVALQGYGLREKLTHFVNAIIVHNRAVGKFKIAYANAESPFGYAAAFALALDNKANIKLYIDYLKTLYLDYEVYTAGAIHNLFKVHGFCPETIELAAARLLSCVGQYGIEQVAELFDGLKGTPAYSELQNTLENYDNDFINKQDFLRYFYEAMDA